MSVAENLKQIKDKISKACQRCGRSPDSVKLIAVSKTKPVSSIIEAIQAGQLIFGENYAQELRDKAKEIENALSPSPLPLSHPATNPLAGRQGRGNNVEWHFVGHLQKNKIKYVLPVASCLHTIDSVELLEAIAKKRLVILSEVKDPVRSLDSSPAAQNDKKVLNCLIEVNIAGESAKSGVSKDHLFSLVEKFALFFRSTDNLIFLRGLMCMPPVSDNPETSRPYFKKLKNLLDEINSRSIYPERLTELSMGMTQDFEVAVEEGATMVRIGTAIFGERG